VTTYNKGDGGGDGDSLPVVLRIFFWAAFALWLVSSLHSCTTVIPLLYFSVALFHFSDLQFSAPLPFFS
jgi:hypothetical protein